MWVYINFLASSWSQPKSKWNMSSSPLTKPAPTTLRQKWEGGILPPSQSLPPLLWGKSGKGAFSQIFNQISGIAPWCYSQCWQNHDDCCGFQKNNSFSECALQEISVPVLILNQLASSVVTGDDPDQAHTERKVNMARRWAHTESKVNMARRWSANEAIVIHVYMFFTQRQS